MLAPGELVRVGGPAAQGRRGLRPARAAVRLARARSGSSPRRGCGCSRRPRRSCRCSRRTPRPRPGCAAIARVLGSGIAAAVLEYVDAAARSRCAGRRRVAGARRRGGVRRRSAEADGSAAEARRVRGELVEALRTARRRSTRPDAAAIRALWRWRDGVSTPSRAARGAKLSEDIAVPLDRLAEAIDGDRRDRRAPRPRGLLVGARGRRQPARDVPARARRRGAAGARGRGRGRAVRARAARSAGRSAASTASACSSAVSCRGSGRRPRSRAAGDQGGAGSQGAAEPGQEAS